MRGFGSGFGKTDNDDARVIAPPSGSVTSHSDVRTSGSYDWKADDVWRYDGVCGFRSQLETRPSRVEVNFCL